MKINTVEFSKHASTNSLDSSNVPYTQRLLSLIVTRGSNQAVSTLCQKSMDDIDELLNKSISNCQFGISDQTIISRHLSIGNNEPPIVSRRCSLYDTGKPLYLPTLVPNLFTIDLPLTPLELQSSYFQDRQVFVAKKYDSKLFTFFVQPLFKEVFTEVIKPMTDFLIMDSQIVTFHKASHKIKTKLIFDCQSYDQCDKCINSGLSICSWCLLRGTCESSQNCPKAYLPIMLTNDLEDPLGMHAKCPSISNYEPPIITTTKPTLIKFSVDDLPYSNELQNRGLQCSTIGIENLPESITASTVSYQISQNGPTYVQCSVTLGSLNTLGNFFIDLNYGNTNVKLANFSMPVDRCAQFSMTSCSQCIENNLESECQWCQARERCSLKNFDGSQQSCGFGAIEGKKQCPTVKGIVNTDGKFQKENKVEIFLSTENAFNKVQLFCIFVSSRWSFSVAAIVIGQKSVYCEPIKLLYDESSLNGITTYNVSLKQNVSSYSAKKALSIEVYDCTKMSTTCSSCASLYNIYKCVWCHDSQTCQYVKNCKADYFITDQGECDEPPIISEFEPSSGPLAGGTEIKIFGKNFGSKSDYIKNVTIGYIVCELKAIYLISSNLDSIICHTKSVAAPFGGRIRVEVKNGLSGYSGNKYNFVEPKIQHFYPKYGPKSGGSLVQIVGENLSIGSQHCVNFETTPVKIHQLSPNYITFYTPYITANESWVNYQVDDGIYHVGKFFYRPDPVILEYYPTYAISSGGTNITFIGENFDFILRAKITIHVQKSFSSTWFVYVNDCSFIQMSLVVCQTPKMEEIFPHKIVNVGLKLDGFEYLDDSGSFHIVPTPTFQTFDRVLIINNNDVIRIYGQNISYFFQNSDFKIFLDKEETCPVVRVDSDENFVECQIYVDKRQILERRTLLVSVEMGSNVLYNLGYVRLAEKSKGIPLMVLLGITISGFCFLTTLGILWYAWNACRVQELYVIK